MVKTFRAEFSSTEHDNRTRCAERLVTCTLLDAGDVQVKIEAPVDRAPNSPFVTLSDERIPAVAWPTVKAAMQAAPQFRLVK